MALRLSCPNCGVRPHTEFWFGGAVEAPHPPSGISDSVEQAANAADFARVWLRRNVAGPQRERWFHHAGCRRWHEAVRDTRTNEVHASA